jgi:hypothetical protein
MKTLLLCLLTCGILLTANPQCRDNERGSRPPLPAHPHNTNAK